MDSNCYLAAKIRTFVFVRTAEAAETVEIGKCAASKMFLSYGEMWLQQTFSRMHWSKRWWHIKSLKCNSSICYRSSCSYLPFVSFCMLRVTPHPNYRQKRSLSFQRVVWVGAAHAFRPSEGSLIITGPWIYWKCCFSPLTLLVSEVSPCCLSLLNPWDCNLQLWPAAQIELVLNCCKILEPLNCFASRKVGCL